jgi:hypothetical protein
LSGCCGLSVPFPEIHVWLGLRNSDDQGTQFDLKADLFFSGTPVVYSGEAHCITGVTRNPAKAKEVVFTLGTVVGAPISQTSTSRSPSPRGSGPATAPAMRRRPACGCTTTPPPGTRASTSLPCQTASPEVSAALRTEGVLLSTCLIVKNEARFLDGCLRSIQDLADEVVVADTGSTDRTKQIAVATGAAGVASVRVWKLMSRRRRPRVGCLPLEGARVGDAPFATFDVLRRSAYPVVEF